MESKPFSIFPEYVLKQHEFVSTIDVSSDLNEDVKQIATHDGTFHCDEALATSLLKFLPEFKNHSILRTRNMSFIEKSDIVVDVGSIYNHNEKRYDHHQQGFDETFDSNHKTRLSSAGLIYKHYGQRIIKTLFPSLSEHHLKMTYNKIYDSFVEAVDGIDNGIVAVEGKSNYSLNTDLASRISHFNPSWIETESKDYSNDRFKCAMALASGEFLEALHSYIEIRLPARSIVESCLDQAETVHPSKSILRLSEKCPWKEHLYSIERERGIFGQTLFVLSPDNDQWRIICVNKSSDTFELRKSLHPDWCALRDDALCVKSGIPGCTFVHRNGFTGGNKTYEGALEMAVKSLEYQS